MSFVFSQAHMDNLWKIMTLYLGYYLIYCAEYPNDWCTDIRFTSGLLLFLLGMGINIHSDLLLRQLRKPGEVTYKIPQGGLFTYVSGANYFGEIVEWFGFAIATWSLPAFAFAFFTLCCIGPPLPEQKTAGLEPFLAPSAEFQASQPSGEGFSRASD
ncbi:hypothetical protein IHE44_0009128 [Lamprotornis superbus]|uniref:3-oxo-5-alpha-steroid 4-dehydrogenase C-terminal domain-containing protein n=1 Tax=Lamprotornis superbus TaxID=245042 RepID=A0A835TY10_9PASS|nr:hypothetical protein IHE44_0009128 [Lamprotornis superbus]